MQKPPTNNNVLIVGAGPAGLMMACQLAMRGISFRIIDKKEQGTTCSGALILHARSLEILDQMGIAEEALQEGTIARKINVTFQGRKTLSLDLKEIGAGLTKYPHILMLEQSRTEKLLTDFINSFGYTIERNTELTTFSQDNEMVTSILTFPDGSEATFLSSYLIAADGSPSLVRKHLNIPFLGKTHELTLFVMDAASDVDLSPDEIHFSFTKQASAGVFPLKRGKWRIDGTILPELKTNDSISFHDIEKGFAPRTGIDIKVQEPDWFSVFHSHQRYAATFCINRCFLIGDAAHVFSPVGAQGMNTGLQDAHNLAWKLAMVIQGNASGSLLNTYNTERQPLAKKIVRHTDRTFQLVSSSHFLAKSIRLLFAPPILTFLFPIVEKQRKLGNYMFKGISQIGIHYRKHVFTKQTSKGAFPGKAPKPGDRLPYIIFHPNGGNSCFPDKMRQVNFHLLIFDRQARDYSKLAEAYKRILSVDVIPFSPETSMLYRRLGIRNEGYYLIRPDMHIACRSNRPEVNDIENFLQDYLQPPL